MLPDKFEVVSAWTVHVSLFRAETAPLSESVGSVGLEILSGAAAAFLVEVVRDGSVDGGEFLETSRETEAEHLPLSSSERQV